MVGLTHHVMLFVGYTYHLLCMIILSLAIYFIEHLRSIRHIIHHSFTHSYISYEHHINVNNITQTHDNQLQPLCLHHMHMPVMCCQCGNSVISKV
jgi:hypothetical protein